MVVLLGEIDLYYISLISSILFLAIEPGIVLWVALSNEVYKKMRNRNKKDEQDEDRLIQIVLETPALCKLFKEHAKKEWSLENVTLWVN
jgi:hypothetical protein